MQSRHDQPSDLRWETRRDGGTVTVAVLGELDLTGAEALDREVRRVEEQAERLVIDLRALEFVDSSGVKVLIDAHRRAVAANRGLRVLPGQGQPARVLRLLEVTSLDVD
jgi:anti-sigma B factor antagonist